MSVREIIPIQPVADEVSLFEIRRKIHPRSVSGAFAFWRWALVFATQLVFYGLPWLTWNGRQAVLFELAERKFYLGGLVLWPQDVVYLAGLLVVAALSLFLFTAVAGRLWCGYACPQTVYTELFMWVERKIEGDRLARIRLDVAPLSLDKVGKRAAKHAIWIAIAAWTGITFVGYFTPIRDLVARLPLGVSGWEGFWVLFYAFATYGNAGWMREQVCKYMCPYARFQSVMFDDETLTIAYDSARGEPRGPRGRKVDPVAAGLGDCIECSICVQVCPTGIDIRNGLQYECIGCGACVDGCNQVMDKMGYARGLIRYASQNGMRRGDNANASLRRVFRLRTTIYASILALIVAGGGAALAMRSSLKVDVLRDRGALAREAAPGVMENVYRLQLMNTAETRRNYSIEVTGLPGARVAGVTLPVSVDASSARLLPLRVQVPADAAAPGPHRIRFLVRAVDDPSIERDEPSTFILPAP